MSVTTEPIVTGPDQRDDIPEVPIYRLTVAQYHAMARAGILDEDAPVELLEGWLVQKMSKNRPHVVVTELLRRALERLIPPDWHIAHQDPITAEDGEPEPDLAVVRGNILDYRDHHPGPKNVSLVVEVADSSLRTDRLSKKRTYARAGIPIYWIANLIESKFEVYTDPTGPAGSPGYRQYQEYGPADEIPVVVDGVEIGRIPVSELLP